MLQKQRRKLSEFDTFKIENTTILFLLLLRCHGLFDESLKVHLIDIFKILIVKTGVV